MKFNRLKYKKKFHEMQQNHILGLGLNLKTSQFEKQCAIPNYEM
jgi:hypothetical protein